MYRLVWLQNDRLMDGAYFHARGELAAHVYRKAHQRRRYATQYVVIGPPQATATATTDELTARDLVGYYALIEEGE